MLWGGRRERWGPPRKVALSKDPGVVMAWSGLSCKTWNSGPGRGTAGAKAPRQEESGLARVAGTEVKRRHGPAPVLQGLWSTVQA